MNDDKKWLNALWRCERMTADRLRVLAGYFPDWKSAFEASFEEILRAGIKPEAVEFICRSRREVDVEGEWERLEKLGVKILCKKDEEYPDSLREINSPPEVLYVKGEMVAQDAVALSVVGSRAVTQYGKQVCEKVVEGVAMAGVTIVSGLALGADAEAHKAALNVGGRTIAVLANGLDSVYPHANVKLAERILDGNGAVISEYPLDAEPRRERFPARNRIVAGLGLGALIIEAAERSGSLITAQMALDFGKEVFAIPGSIFSKQSEGTNNLFKNTSAQVVTSAFDILETLNVDKKIAQKEFDEVVPKDPVEKMVWEMMSEVPVLMDDLVSGLSLGADEVGRALTLMEMRGVVRNVGGGMWRRG